MNHLYLMHILFVGPLLVYSGYTGYNHCPRKHDKGIFLFLGAVGLVVMLYHIFMYYKMIQK